MESLRGYYSEVAANCPNSLWVLAGYSQGAMVVAEAVKSFYYDKVVYIALFGDPKLDLPEGKGLFADACFGKNLSDYRVYVPTCRTHTGSLGARNPYVYGELAGKYGLWCGKDDYICGSTALPWNYAGHMRYPDRMSQLVGILRGRLPYRTGSVTRAMATSGVYALLALDTYYAHPGQEVVIDASQSFSLDIDIAEYEWRIDDGVFWADSAVITRSFENAGEHSVTVRVTDWLDSVAEYTSQIIVTEDEVITDYLPAPMDVVARRVGDDIVLDWSEAELMAPYLWVRINDFDLGYVEATRGVLTISDVEFDEEILLEAAWLSEDAVSEWREVGWVEDEDGPVEVPEEVPFVSPNTGVTFAEGIIPCFVLILCVAVVWKILWA